MEADELLELEPVETAAGTIWRAPEDRPPLGAMIFLVLFGLLVTGGAGLLGELREDRRRLIGRE